jgi:hypothetical protein
MEHGMECRDPRSPGGPCGFASLEWACMETGGRVIFCVLTAGLSAKGFWQWERFAKHLYVWSEVMLLLFLGGVLLFCVMGCCVIWVCYIIVCLLLV